MCMCVLVRHSIEAASILHGFCLWCVDVCVRVYACKRKRENDPKSQIQYGADASCSNSNERMNVLDGVCMPHRNNKIFKNLIVVRLKFVSEKKILLIQSTIW